MEIGNKDLIEVYSIHNYKKIFSTDDKSYYFLSWYKETVSRPIKLNLNLGRNYTLSLPAEVMEIHEVNYREKEYYKYLIYNSENPDIKPCIETFIYKLLFRDGDIFKVKFLSVIREEYDLLPIITLNELKKNTLKNDLESFQKSLFLW